MAVELAANRTAGGNVFAHASGFSWDEGLLVLSPIFLIVLLLVWSRRREARRAGMPGSKR